MSVLTSLVRAGKAHRPSALFTLILLGSTPLTAQPDPSDAEVVAAFDQLQQVTEQLEPEPGIENSLLQQIRTAREAYLRQSFCAALNKLKAFLNHLRTVQDADTLPICELGGRLWELIFTTIPPGEECRVEPPEPCSQLPGSFDLVASSFSSEQPYVYENEGVGVLLLVENRGTRPVEGLLIRFLEGDAVFAEATIGSLDPDAEREVRVYWPGGASGIYTLSAVVDPLDEFQELLETNNVQTLELSTVFEAVRPFELPDLVLSELAPATDRPAQGEGLRLVAVAAAEIPEAGDPGLTIEACPVRFFADGEQFWRSEISLGPPDFTAETEAVWTAQSGRHRLTASVECPDLLERDATNNLRSALVHGSPAADAELPDVIIQDFTLAREDDGKVKAMATLRNIGWADANDLPIRFQWLSDESSPELQDLESMDASLSEDRLDLLTSDPVIRTVSRIAAGTSVEIEMLLEVEDYQQQLVTLSVDPENFLDMADADAPRRWTVEMVDPRARQLCIESFPWENAEGPSILLDGNSGRIDSLVVDPRNLQRMWAAAPTGGIWRSLNAGQSWSPLGDRLPSMEIGPMAIDPTNSQILYAGSSTGIYKSIDGGTTWHTFISGIGKQFSKILVRYRGSGQDFEIFAAGATGLWHYESSDKFLIDSLTGDWTNLKSGWITGLVLDPSDAEKIYLGVLKEGVYRSKPGQFPTGDASWDLLGGGLPTSVDSTVRLGISESNPNILYAGIKTSGEFRLYRSANHGDSWQLRFTGDTETRSRRADDHSQISSSSGYWENFYNAYVEVDPTNPNRVYMGHIQGYYSGNGGLGFARIPGIHDDQHGFLFDPDDPSVVYLTGDGGIFRCAGETLSCEHRNSELRTIMFYDVAVSETFSSLVIGGTQDNGTIASTGSPVWQQLRGGDGRYVAIDPNEHQRIYSQHQYLQDTRKAENWLNANNSVSMEWRAAPGLPSGPSSKVPKSQWYLKDPYFIGHPWDSDVLLTAGPESYTHTDATGDWATCTDCTPWTPIGPDSSLNTDFTGHVTRVAMGQVSEGEVNMVYYAGTSTGQIWRSENQGIAWSKVFAHPTKASVSGLTVDPQDPTRIWITSGGWGHADHRVWTIKRYTTQYDGDYTGPGGGVSLVYDKIENITSNLPNARVLGSGWKMSNMIAVHPTKPLEVYVATDRGVYRGKGAEVNGSLNFTWVPFNCGLPWVQVCDLEIRISSTAAASLSAATYGRGLWRRTLPLQ